MTFFCKKNVGAKRTLFRRVERLRKRYTHSVSPFTKIANQRKRMTGTPHGGAAHLRRTSVLRAKPWRRANSLRPSIFNYRGVKRPQGAEPKKEDMTFVMSSFLELMM